MTTKKQKKTNPSNAKLVKKQPEPKEIAKKFTPDEVRDLVKKSLKADCDPDQIFQTAAEKITIIASGSKKEADKAEKELMEISNKSLMPLGLETHYALAETIDTRYRPLVIEVARQIEKEYNCETPTEKILAETIAGTYGKIIEYSKQLECCTRLEYLSNEKNGYYAMLSKELDRAHRQLITALTTLKQIKSPPIELNVKAKTAFVAQNQQINAVNNPVQQDENINPK